MRGGEDIEAQIRRAQRGSAAAGGDAYIQRVVGQFIERNLRQTLRDFALLKEKVEVLTAERGRADDAAVRRGQLGRLQQLPQLTSRKVSSAPSASDFNALVADVHGIHQQLAAIADLLARLSR